MPKKIPTQLFAVGLSLLVVTKFASAATLRVPQDHRTIGAAIEAAKPGDTVLVSAGTYREQIKLKPNVTLKSAGDDAKGKLGLKRAEATIIDGEGKANEEPGVAMSAGSVLDGFTVTNVGFYDDERWKKHHATQGDEQSYLMIGTFGAPAIGIAGVDCTLRHNIVHHNGFSGVAVRGKCSPHIVENITYRNMGGGVGLLEKCTAIVERNTCFENFYAGIGHASGSKPLVIDNICYANIRAGIGISEGAQPIVRRNRCFKNRRAGVGIRTGSDTRPIVEDNDCYENDMAGIGSKQDARPIIRNNRCYKNKLAGIGTRENARAIIEDNECYENGMSGIGSRLGAAPIVRNNRCYRNMTAGIGAREESRPIIVDNECFENQQAGIGSREEALPIIRGNKCYKNAMAGIGSMQGARAVIVENICYQNIEAGIGAREEAVPVICRNECYDNQMAGIGCREGALPVIVDNVSRNNHTAGIGLRSKETIAVVVNNQCLENKLVAIGIPDGATAFVHGNTLVRTGGMPPMVAVNGGSKLHFSQNTVRGGGVAGILVQGDAYVSGNRFEGNGPRGGGPPNFAVWGHEGARIHFSDNHVDRWRHAIHSTAAGQVAVHDNVVNHFIRTAIVISKPAKPGHAFGNVAYSENEQDQVAVVDGPQGIVGDNVRKSEPQEEAKSENVTGAAAAAEKANPSTPASEKTPSVP